MGKSHHTVGLCISIRLFLALNLLGEVVPSLRNPEKPGAVLRAFHNAG